MKKIGIITINDFNNYGNRVQCYAVQEKLKELNFIVENIYNVNKKKMFISNIKRKIKKLLNYNNARELDKRSERFKEFNKNIKFSNRKIINGKTNKNLNKEYNFFVVGSDQVWNPNFNTTSDADFLTFASDNKKIALSASFGISELPKNVVKDYKEKLNKFKKISVREEAGKKIIEQITDRTDVEVLIDPTMLLDEREWAKVSKRPEQLDRIKKDKYILNYFLGELSEKRKKEIERIAKENNCHIINILDKNDPFYITGPSEFLYLEKNAFLICTDSFHSSVFAILFNRPFVVFNREDNHVNMNSRIDTLLSKFKLENRKYNGKEITKENLKHDYTEAYKILEKERKKSEEFLKKAFDIE